MEHQGPELDAAAHCGGVGVRDQGAQGIDLAGGAEEGEEVVGAPEGFEAQLRRDAAAAAGPSQACVKEGGKAMVQDYVPQVSVQDYVLQVSEGVYMGSGGGFAGSPPEGVPVLPATKYQLPIDPKKVKDALNSFAEAVKSITDPNDPTILLLRRLGITGELLKALKDFGKVSAAWRSSCPTCRRFPPC